MVEDKKTKDEILERLKQIEDKIDSQKQESLASDEDQLFFGVIISLLVLFVTLPINDLTSFLQSVFSVDQSIASTNAGYIKYLGIIFLLASTLTRYCAVVSDPDASKKFRYASFEALWLALDIIILNIIINLITTLSLQIGLSGLSVTFLILTSIFIGMRVLEEYILKVYARKGLIMEKPFPFASLLFLSIMIGISIALLVEIAALILGFGPFSTIRFLTVYLLITIVCILASLRRSSRKKKPSN